MWVLGTKRQSPSRATSRPNIPKVFLMCWWIFLWGLCWFSHQCLSNILTHHIVVVVVAISFSGFGIGVTLSLQNVFGRISLSSAWENNLKRISVSSSLDVQWKLAGHRILAFLWEVFFFYCLFNIVIIGLSFSIYSSFNLDKEHFSASTRHEKCCVQIVSAVACPFPYLILFSSPSLFLI